MANEQDFMIQNPKEERYNEELSPFEEFLPGMRPSNSDDYLSRLALAMMTMGMDEASVWRQIVEHSVFVLDEEHVRHLVHRVFSSPLEEREKMVMSKTQRETLALHDFMRRRYSLRRNEVTGVIEYCERKRYHTRFRPVDELVLNSISFNAREEGINVWDRDVKRYLRSDRVVPYNPFEAFLSNLPQWDKSPRIEKFFRRVPVDDEKWYSLAHTWFLGMVALWLGKNRRKGNESMPILVGEQGVGKSTFCRSILPPELAPYYTENFALADRRKALLMLTRYGLINFDEVNRLTDHQQPILKNMLQLPVVDEFKPYASFSVQEQRFASLIGTSNNTDVITDLTGSRRFICTCVTGRINMNRPVNYPQLYAEAVWEITAGHPYWLNEAEEASLMERNMRFVRMPADAELFDIFFDAAEEGEQGSEWLYASEIHHRLHPSISKPMTTGELRNFRAVMNGRHVHSKRAKAGMVYLVKPKKPRLV